MRTKSKLEILVGTEFIPILEEGKAYLTLMKAQPIFFDSKYDYYIRPNENGGAKCVVYRIKKQDE